MKSSCLVIAEAGVNHNGSLENAKKLVDLAAEAGADIVKFQTFSAGQLVTAEAEMAQYQKDNTGKSQSQYELLKKLELSQSDHHALMAYCQKQGIEFLSTAFDDQSLQFLKDLGLQRFKIPSGEMTNYPYLKQIASFRPKQVYMSTGMATLEEVQASFNLLVEFGIKPEQIVVLHCTTDYPTALKDVNLQAMRTLATTLGCPVGYSDHTVSTDVPLAAVAMGAVVIEKHFTIDRNMEGPDHKASLEGPELKEMIRKIRDFSVYQGDGVKKPTAAELENRKIARKSIVARTSIKSGEVFTEQNLGTKRPGSGLSPMKWNQVLGQKAKKNFNPDELIET